MLLRVIPVYIASKAWNISRGRRSREIFTTEGAMYTVSTRKGGIFIMTSLHIILNQGYYSIRSDVRYVHA